MDLRLEIIGTLLNSALCLTIKVLAALFSAKIVIILIDNYEKTYLKL